MHEQRWDVRPSAAEGSWIDSYLVESDGSMVKRDKEAREHLILIRMGGHSDGGA